MKRFLFLVAPLLLLAVRADAQSPNIAPLAPAAVCTGSASSGSCVAAPASITAPMPVQVVAGASAGSTIVGADVVVLPGPGAITMFATGHCANGCRVSVPVAFCTNPLTTATSTATTGGNECWLANQSVALPPTAHAVSVFSTVASTASGIGSTVP